MHSTRGSQLLKTQRSDERALRSANTRYSFAVISYVPRETRDPSRSPVRCLSSPIDLKELLSRIAAYTMRYHASSR